MKLGSTDFFASNTTSKRDIHVKDIFGNPIYEKLIGLFATINQKFNGDFNTVLANLKQTFGFNRQRPL